MYFFFLLYFVDKDGYDFELGLFYKLIIIEIKYSKVKMIISKKYNIYKVLIKLK